MYVYSSPHEHRTVMIVLTVTPINRLHKSDEPNGVKGAAEEDKIWDKAWRAQRVHVHGPKKVEPILCVESLIKRRPRLVHHVSDP